MNRAPEPALLGQRRRAEPAQGARQGRRPEGARRARRRRQGQGEGGWLADDGLEQQHGMGDTYIRTCTTSTTSGEWFSPKDDVVARHSGFLRERDENFQISGHENIFSRYVLQVLANTQ